MLERPTGERNRDPRREVLESYTTKLMHSDSEALIALVPSEPGYWGLSELDVDVDGIPLRTMAFRSFEQASALLFVVEVVSGRAMHRVFSDGFAVDTDGTARPMEPEEWALLNL